MISNISFKSSIRPVTLSDFRKETSKIPDKNFVGYPWSVNDSIKAQSSYTKDVADCTVCGITDGANVFLMHLSPENEINHSLFILRQIIARNVDLNDKNLQAILIGSKPTTKSSDIYNKLCELINSFNIPFSELKFSKSRVNVAYFSNKDEWIVASNDIDKLLKFNNRKEDVLKNSFNKVEISEFDEIV